MNDAYLRLINDRYAQRRTTHALGWAAARTYARKRQSFDRMMAAYALPKGARVLELGCGAGNLALHMAMTGYDAYGVDLAAPAIAWARDAARQRRLPARFLEGNVADLRSFRNNMFDVAFDGDCLWMVLRADRPACFASIFRILKPGGLLYAQARVVKAGFRRRYTMAPGATFDPVRRVSTVHDVPMYQYSTERGFCREIRKAGFEICQCAPLVYGRSQARMKAETPFVAGSLFIVARKPRP